jgi:hypothetical protein
MMPAAAAPDIHLCKNLEGTPVLLRKRARVEEEEQTAPDSDILDTLPGSASDFTSFYLVMTTASLKKMRDDNGAWTFVRSQASTMTALTTFSVPLFTSLNSQVLNTTQNQFSITLP